MSLTMEPRKRGRSLKAEAFNNDEADNPTDEIVIEVSKEIPNEISVSNTSKKVIDVDEVDWWKKVRFD